MPQKIMKTIGKVQQFEYTLTYRRGMRSITMRVAPGGAIKVNAPYFTTKTEVERLIVKNADRFQKFQTPAVVWQDGASLYLAGNVVTLTTREDVTQVHLENSLLLAPPLSPPALKHAVYRFYQQEALRRVVPMVKAWKQELSLTVGRITIRNNHRVWASCSRSGNLSFAVRIAGLGDPELSYLVLHELAHRVHFNHGPAFHAYLDQHMPSWRVMERNLRVMQKKCDIFGE